jgi:archaellum component FlaC
MSFKCMNCELRSDQCCIRELLKRIQQLEHRLNSQTIHDIGLEPIKQQIKSEIDRLDQRITNMPRGEPRFGEQT